MGDDNSRAPSHTFLIDIFKSFPSLLFLFHFREPPTESWMGWTMRIMHTATTNLYALIVMLTAKPTLPARQIREDDAYHTKYTEKLKKVREMDDKTKSETEPPSLYHIVMENTPSGYVAMQYDAGRVAFTYYANNTIPTKHLCTVARKFAVQFHTPRLLTPPSDPTPETKRNGKGETEPRPTTSEARLQSRPSEVDRPHQTGAGIHSGRGGARFAKLKNRQEPEPETDTKPDTKPKLEPDAGDGSDSGIGPRFIRVGRLVDLVVLRLPPEPASTVRVRKNMTFAEYKKLTISIPDPASSDFL
jgi:hypothetical protein